VSKESDGAHTRRIGTVVGEQTGCGCASRSSSATRPAIRRGLSRTEAAIYLGISPSKFDELRKDGRVGPPKVLDGRLIFTVERLDEFLDALPDENHEAAEDWTAAV
jgi:hypothetical protein